MRGGEIKYAMTMTAFGQMLGLVGMAMFALNFVLSARLKFLESIFGGMNKIYTAHHILGGLSFVLLLLHPLFLIAKYLTGGAVALRGVAMSFLLDSGCIAHFSLFEPACSTTMGVVSLTLMILFLVLTFFVKLPYHIWKFTHQFLGFAFFFGALHVLTIPSDVTTINILKYYMFFLIVLGFASILYRTVLGFFLVPRREFLVEEVRQVNSSIIEITMTPKEGKCINYIPGQFVFVSFPDSEGLEEVHPFSLSSAPGTNKICVGVKALGDYTKHLCCDLKAGVRAIVEGPFGRTSYAFYPKKEQIWIAGGIGITPFLGMARSLKPEDGYKIDLYYSVVDRSEAAFIEDLETVAFANPNFRLVPWYTKEKSFLNAEAIVNESNGVLGKEIFLCGPPGMMKAMKAQFGKWKVPVANIHSEEFSMS